MVIGSAWLFEELEVGVVRQRKDEKISGGLSIDIRRFS